MQVVDVYPKVDLRLILVDRGGSFEVHLLLTQLQASLLPKTYSKFLSILLAPEWN